MTKHKIGGLRFQLPEGWHEATFGQLMELSKATNALHMLQILAVHDLPRSDFRKHLLCIDVEDGFTKAVRAMQWALRIPTTEECKTALDTHKAVVIGGQSFQPTQDVGKCSIATLADAKALIDRMQDETVLETMLQVVGMFILGSHEAATEHEADLRNLNCLAVFGWYGFFLTKYSGYLTA